MNLFKSLLICICLTLFSAEVYGQCCPPSYPGSTYNSQTSTRIKTVWCNACGTYHRIIVRPSQPSTCGPVAPLPDPPTVDPGDIPPSLPPDINIPVPGEPNPSIPPAPTNGKHHHKDLEDRLDAIDTKLDELIAGMGNNDTDPIIEQKFFEFNERLTTVEETVRTVEQKVIDIMDLPQVNPDTIAEQVYNKVKVDIDAINVNIENKLTIIQEKLGEMCTPPEPIDYERIIAEVIKRLGDVDVDDPEPMLLYFTVEGLESCRLTDTKAQGLKEAGYPIIIITLEPNEVSVRDVPRVFNTRTNKEVRGTSNVITYFSSLTT